MRNTAFFGFVRGIKCLSRKLARVSHLAEVVFTRVAATFYHGKKGIFCFYITLNSIINVIFLWCNYLIVLIKNLFLCSEKLAHLASVKRKKKLLFFLAASTI